ncbi:chemotaxis protein CheW [Silanimonas sp.]|uniref:chemotaxis protein CheW n=1 Tax=Silanimonas sp. TaxID=1929290 RepID=UPI0022C36E67|nr:chemotaxis protein CheW [Silanimonas sp.]MCZ8115602.1 chemotaxis protein CheW [Silanimonas sp.]
MSGGLVDDYLSQLLGAAAAGTMAGDPAPVAPAPATAPVPAPPEPAAAPPPAAEVALPTPAVAPEPVVTVSTPPPANPDEITEDEFEALLDALHGDAPPGAITPAPAAPAPAPKAPANPDEISEDEFEALLDALHGGAPPGAVTPAPVPTAAAPAKPAAAGDEITEDEFEALLDNLHGGKPPGAVALAANVAVAAARATAAPAPRPEPEPAPVSDTSDEGDDWRGQERRASRRSSRWLRMRVHGQDYGVELLKVQEVLLPVGVLPMRDTDAAILGVMNLRGVVVPVLDLGVWLGLEEVEESAQTRYVVLEQNGDCLALKVSAVLDVHAIADGQVEPAENTLAAPGSAMLRGVTRLNSQPVILLDAVGLLG